MKAHQAHINNSGWMAGFQNLDALYLQRIKLSLKSISFGDVDLDKIEGESRGLGVAKLIYGRVTQISRNIGPGKLVNPFNHIVFSFSSKSP